MFTTNSRFAIECGGCGRRTVHLIPAELYSEYFLDSREIVGHFVGECTHCHRGVQVHDWGLHYEALAMIRSLKEGAESHPKSPKFMS